MCCIESYWEVVGGLSICADFDPLTCPYSLPRGVHRFLIEVTYGQTVTNISQIYIHWRNIQHLRIEVYFVSRIAPVFREGHQNSKSATPKSPAFTVFSVLVLSLLSFFKKKIRIYR